MAFGGADTEMFSALQLLLLLGTTEACTTIIAGKKATADGSVMCTHSNDGEGNTDPRLVHIPARDHGAGAKRPIFFAPENYPRYTGVARGDVPAYRPVGNQSAMKPIGFIPEVAHTFAYHEDTYGALNEHQLGIGESTCSGKFGTKPLGQGGKAMMSVDTLSQLAMERTKSSRDAVKLMGALAEKYGFYGAGSFEGTAESLLVTDPEEGFIFHILPDDTGTSAIWAAQRVPDDHIGVVANAFVIREVNFSDPFNFLGSASVHAVAQKKGWWSPSEGLLDFTLVYSDGEYAHKYYSGRRVWGVYHLLSPSLELNATYEEYRRSKPYPVTAPPDKKVSVEDIARAMRYYYEGTAYDQTVGLAGGPFGDPDHALGGPGSHSTIKKGNWERTIGLWRTSDSYIVQSRSWLPAAKGGVLWWGAHAAPYTVYVPLTGGMAALPRVTLGHQAVLDKGTLFWAIRYIANLAKLKHSYMIKEISAFQTQMHAEGARLLAAADAADGQEADPGDALARHSAHVAEGLVELFDKLMFKYSDGFINVVQPDGSFSSSSVPYPDWWLKAVGYEEGPPPVPPTDSGVQFV